MCCPACSCCPKLRDLYKDDDQLQRLPEYKLDKRVCWGQCCPLCLKFCCADNYYCECHPKCLHVELAYCLCCASDISAPCFSGCAESVPATCGCYGWMCYPHCACCPVMSEFYPNAEDWVSEPGVQKAMPVGAQPVYDGKADEQQQPTPEPPSIPPQPVHPEADEGEAETVPPKAAMEPPKQARGCC